jgi:hypothetical protein
MPDDLFSALEDALRSGPPAAALDLLLDRFRTAGEYSLLFEARLMRKRLEMGMPLVQTEATSSLPDPQRTAYEQEIVEAAREVGALFLAAGNIEAGYRYLRAVGETAPVAEAIEKTDPGEQLEAVIGIAFQEGVHPARGLELILKHHGMCRAITSFGMYAVQKDREACIGLLVRGLHAEIVERMAGAIEQREGVRPESARLPELMQGRDWLFGEYDTYVDTSHLSSLLPYGLEVTDRAVLELLSELCDYGRHLSENFRFQGPPPFENGYVGYGHFVDAVLGCDVEQHLDYFRAIAAAEPEAAQTLVNLLVRLKRPAEALDVFLEYLGDEDPSYLRCPSALQLCHMAGDFTRMRDLARQRGDVLSFTAASLLR